ncbi:hypothetical protein HY407_01865 [Candidatus Gottesmanbacteria bacterium]|nr:hypothetical protein [Candidatus Gottesmanbacteria bacterium]
MKYLEGLEAWDVTDEVRAIRQEMGIDGEAESGGQNYTIYHPRVLVFENGAGYDGYAANGLKQTIRDNSSPKITVSSGNTPIAIYGLLTNEAIADESLRKGLGRTTFYALDEVWPAGNMPSVSYATYYDENLVRPMGLDAEQVVIFDGWTTNPEGEVKRVDDILRDNPRHFGLIGIGPDERVLADGTALPASDHMAFVPKGTPLEARSGAVDVDLTTRYVNGNGNPGNFPFDRSMTQGPANIVFENDRNFFGGKGDRKKINLAERVLFVKPNPNNPASQITFGKNVTVGMDIPAAELVLARIEDRSRQIFPVAQIAQPTYT